MPQTLYPDAINKLKLFSGLQEEEKGKLLRDGKIRWYSKGQHLFRSGSPISHFYIVCSGVMQIFRETPDGHEVTTDVIGSGRTLCKTEIFGLCKGYHQVSALAVEDSVVLEFPAQWLRDIAKIPNVALNILSAISLYTHMIEIEIEHKSTLSAAQQVACFMQRLCLMHGLNPEGFELPYSKSLIASKLGMKPETFSRTLQTLEQHGLTVSGNHVTFRDMGAISEYVCSHCSVVDDCETHQLLKKKVTPDCA